MRTCIGESALAVSRSLQRNIQTNTKMFHVIILYDCKGTSMQGHDQYYDFLNRIEISI